MSRRLCFVLDLKNDVAKITEYESFHRPGGVWPTIVDDIRAQGIEGMEIWRSGERMVMIATVADDYPRARTVPPEYDRWETLMWTFQKALSHAAPGQKWVPMAKIFDLAEQTGTVPTHRRNFALICRRAQREKRVTGLKISKVRARAVNVPLSAPHPTAGGTVTSAPLVLIDLETDGGVTGRTYLFCYTAFALKPVARLVESFGELIAGDMLAPLEIFRKIQGRLRLLGPQGLTGMAAAGIDMAAWDALAVAQGLPLAALLGGRPGAVPAYHSCAMGGIEGAIRDTESSVKLGFNTLKFKIGYGDATQDLAVLKAARKAGGVDMKLLVDYNQSLDVTSAIARERVLEEMDLVWIEEPTTADDYAGHAAIAASAVTPIQIGENMWGPTDFEKAIAEGFIDGIMLDVMKIGGVTGWMKAAALAEIYGIRVSSHLFPEVSAQLLSVTKGAQLLEWQDWVAPVLAEPLVPKGGIAQAATAPGSGIAWNEPAIAKCLA